MVLSDDTRPIRKTLREKILTLILRIFFRLLYQEFAWSYNLISGFVSLGKWQAWVMSVLPYLTGPRVLELGFGPGKLQAALSTNGKRAYGLDASWQMSSYSFDLLVSLGCVPLLVNGYAQFMPFASDFFNQVVATFPSEYIIHPDTLDEIYRVLAPGGSFVCLPLAWITGQSRLERLAAGLFRTTGQAPEWDNSWLKLYEGAGFVNLLVDKLSLETSQILIFHGEKPL
jgi:ubiquinone/menaquinone biosynthesis C-methylase UbiE